MIRQTFLALVLSSQAASTQPTVVVDIPPLHSLTAKVMQGIAVPDLLLQPNMQAHHPSLKPSQIQSMSQADLIIWTGGLFGETFSGRLLSVAPEALLLDVNAVTGVTLYDPRDAAIFSHDHGHHDHDDHNDQVHAEHDDHDDHDADDDHADHDADDGHADHDDHGDEDHANHDDHGDEDDHNHAKHEEHDDHNHGTHDDHAKHDNHSSHADHDDHDGHPEMMDPHSWLDTQNARRWVNAFVLALSEIDPEHASTYAANAAQAKEDMDRLDDEIRTILSGTDNLRYVLGHDAFQYFEAQFDLAAVGALVAHDADQPGPARIKALRAAMTKSDVNCIIAEPGENTGLLQTLTEGLAVNVAIVDQLGRDLPAGPDQYARTLRNVAKAFAGCAKPQP